MSGKSMWRDGYQDFKLMEASASGSDVRQIIESMELFDFEFDLKWSADEVNSG